MNLQTQFLLYDIVSTKVYNKRDDFDFEIVNFPILDGDVPRSTSYGVFIFQLIQFARASICSHVADFNTHNKLFYYIPITDTTLELSVFWPSNTESRINELRFSESISLSFKTRLTSVTCFCGDVT